jgi:Ca2+-transporting ATPase
MKVLPNRPDTEVDASQLWHHIEVSDVLRILRVDPEIGLSTDEVSKRHAAFGANELIERGQKSAWKILQEQLTGIFVVILMLAGITSFFLGDNKDAAAVFAIVLLNTILGFTQEFRAEKAITSLKRMAVPRVTVRRDGNAQIVAGPKLVPGDILSLESGSVVPADCRLLETRNLRVQEAVLTGEAEPVEKQSGPIRTKDVALADRTNMVYSGTFVTYGRAEAVVVQTGMRTELGRIAEMLQMVHRQPTPLQQRLERLARDLAIAATMLVSLVCLIDVIRGEDLKLVFFTSISLLVAAVPEGLPAVVTIALALGTQRMLRRRALVRKLAAVETLGSVSVICSDKTGTLTENRMTLVMLDVAGNRLQVAEHIHANDLADQPELDARILRDSGYMLMMTGAALCNDAILQPEATAPERFRAIGDPTEAAMVVAAAHFGLVKPLLEDAFPRINEVPFESGRKRMTTVHRIDHHQIRIVEEKYPAIRFPLAGVGIGTHIAFTKGAVDVLLEFCSHAWVDTHRKVLTQESRERIETTTGEFARMGMRVLGIAVRSLGDMDATGSGDSLERDLTFIGLLGLTDPPRDGVKHAIETCRHAGVRTVMITGDHPATANQIARELALDGNTKTLTGTDLSHLTIDELANVVDDVSVYARVSPEHKLKIVDALQRRGHIVSMTGDGVNDAPALRKANIGVAMGIAGTDVAKEASDMVLLDDNFTTIVSAVEEGRVIYDNLRKFIMYALTGNAGEILVMLLAPFAGMPLPLLPLQILWINLVTDGLPGLALAVEPAERDTMKRPPFRVHESVFAGGMAWRIVWIGLLVGLVSHAMGYWYWHLGRPEWQTVVFTTLTLSELASVLAIRSSKESLFRIGLFSNPQLIGVVVFTLMLQMALLYVPSLQSIFKTMPLPASDLVVVLLASTAIFWAIELQKYAVRKVVESRK